MSTGPEAAPSWTPRFATGFAVAICCVPIVVLCLPMLAGNILGGASSDQTWTGIPFGTFWAREFHRTGHVPLWNPYLFGGLPFVGAMHGDLFYPTSFLRLLVPAAAASNIAFALHFVLAGLLTYLFLRVVGATWTASVTGGLAYQLSGIVISLGAAGQGARLAVSTLLPLLLTGLVMGIRRRRVEGFGLAALAVGLDLLSPQAQMTQYSLVFAGLLALFLCFLDEERPGSARERWTALGLAALAVVLGAGLSAIQMLPFIGYAPYSAQAAAGHGWAHATSLAMPPASIADWLVPNVTGTLELYADTYLDKLHSAYVGAATLALAAVGLAGRPRRRLVWFLAGSLALFVLVCLGAHTPFYRIWYAILPGVKATHAPGMAFFIPTFIIACFAAFGAERLGRGEGSRALLGVLGGAAVLLLLGPSGALASLARALAGPSPVPAQAAAGPIARSAVHAALAAAALALAGLAAVRGRVRALPLASLLVAIVAADLFVNARRYFRWSVPPRELYADDDVTRRMRATAMPYRALDFPGSGGVYRAAYLMERGIPNAIGRHGNELNAYDQLLGGRETWSNLGTQRLWDLLALRYVVWPVPLPLPGYHVVAHALSPAGGALEATLYEADTVPPYARLLGAAVKVPEAQIVPTLLDPRFEYDRLLLLPEDAPVAPPRLDSLPPVMAGRAAVAAWNPGAMTIRLEQPPERDAWLLVSENWYPDWHARVDGREAPVVRGQKTFLAVPVGRGAREVRLWFASASYATGKGITLASLAVIVVGTLAPPARRRRRG